MTQIFPMNFHNFPKIIFCLTIKIYVKMKRLRFLFAMLALTLVCAIPVVAADGDTTGTTIPGSIWQWIGGGSGIIAALVGLWKGAKVFLNKFGKASGEVVDVVTVSLTELSQLGMTIAEGVGGLKSGFAILEQATANDRTPTKEEIDLILASFKSAYENLKEIKPEFDDAMVKIQKEIKDVTTVLRAKQTEG